MALRTTALATVTLALVQGAATQFVTVAPGGNSFQVADLCDDFAVSAYHSWQAIEAGAGLCCGGAAALNVQLDAAARSGLNTVRIFGFATQEGVNLQTAPGEYDESVLVGLDTVVAAAGERGLKIIIALANNWDYTGNSSDSKAYYTNQSRTAASPDDFWTDATAIRDYLAHVETLTARVNTINTLAYNADPAILGWDLINEGRCDGGASCSAAQIQAWLGRVAPAVKSYVPNQLVTIGQEGFWQRDNCASDTTNPVNNTLGWPLQTGQDYLANHAVEGIDFASVHLTPVNWARTDNTFGTAWLNGHAKQASLISKPLLVELFSFKIDQTQDVVEQNATDYYKLVYAVTEASIVSDGAIRGIGFGYWGEVQTSPDAPGFDATSVVASDSDAFVETIGPFSRRVAGRCPAVALSTVPPAARGVAPAVASVGPTAAATVAGRRLLQATAPAPVVSAGAINAEVPRAFCRADTAVHATPALAPEAAALAPEVATLAPLGP